jgi:GH15 family glucan-1,4-alpha-glucosidase
VALRIEDTEMWWRVWVSSFDLAGEWREVVVRSLMTLKALTYDPTGGIVAAPTTSLPETVGGVRNWDYRLLPATRTRCGCKDEARAWRNRLLRAAAGDPPP